MYAVKVETHAVTNGEESDDGKRPGRGQSGGITEVEECSSDTADDDAELELYDASVCLKRSRRG